MIVETFPVGALACNCTILGDEQRGEAIVVDGGDGADEVARRLQRLHLRATALVHTHAHIDHIREVARLRDVTGARALLHTADLPLYGTLAAQAAWLGVAAPPVAALDGDLRDGERLSVGSGACVEVIHTPGHTPGSVCFALHAENETVALLTGDTLFAGSIGRWDLGGTSMEDIVASVQTRLMVFDDATRVIPGHGPFTTIGAERRTNPYLAHG